MSSAVDNIVAVADSRSAATSEKGSIMEQRILWKRPVIREVGLAEADPHIALVCTTCVATVAIGVRDQWSGNPGPRT